MKWKEGDRLTRRLILTLIVCGLVMIALAVLGGVALSGVLWYQDQVTVLQEENKKAAALLQSQVDELESQLKQAQEEISLVFTLGADGMLTCALRLSGLD